MRLTYRLGASKPGLGYTNLRLRLSNCIKQWPFRAAAPHQTQHQLLQIWLLKAAVSYLRNIPSSEKANYLLNLAYTMQNNNQGKAPHATPQNQNKGHCLGLFRWTRMVPQCPAQSFNFVHCFYFKSSPRFVSPLKNCQSQNPTPTVTSEASEASPALRMQINCYTLFKICKTTIMASVPTPHNLQKPE